MCIVIDSCSIASVFNGKASDHHEFKPVLLWITKRDGKMVFGGSKYKKELAALKTYHRIIGELRKAGRCKVLDDTNIDRIQRGLERSYKHRDFDDPHLVAIIIESKVRVICTNEKRAIPWLTKTELYPTGVKKPKIYTGSRNKDLLNSQNVVRTCK